MTYLLHSSAVVFDGFGLLIQGASGAGKSGLALRLIEAGGFLISDDQTLLKKHHNTLIACPPDTLKGLIEVRGVGIITRPYLSKALIHHSIICACENAIERMPEPQSQALHGVVLPVMVVDPGAVSAVAKIRARLHYTLHD